MSAALFDSSSEKLNAGFAPSARPWGYCKDCRVAGPYGWVDRLALATGMRWGELCRAQRTDLVNGFLVVSKTKSSKLRRIPLDPELEREIKGRVGRLIPFSETSYYSFVRGVQRNAELTTFHAHQLRHAFACQWIEDGGPLPALQQVVGTRPSSPRNGTHG